MIALRRGATEVGHEDYMDGKLKIISRKSLVNRGISFVQVSPTILSCCANFSMVNFTDRTERIKISKEINMI